MKVTGFRDVMLDNLIVTNISEQTAAAVLREETDLTADLLAGRFVLVFEPG
jgi:hypothetical protein